MSTFSPKNVRKMHSLNVAIFFLKKKTNFQKKNVFATLRDARTLCKKCIHLNKPGLEQINVSRIWVQDIAGSAFF